MLLALKFPIWELLASYNILQTEWKEPSNKCSRQYNILNKILISF